MVVKKIRATKELLSVIFLYCRYYRGYSRLGRGVFVQTRYIFYPIFVT